MTREELLYAQTAISRANDLLAMIASCEKYQQMTAQLHLRSYGGETVSSAVGDAVIVAGLAAVRRNAEEELERLSVMPDVKADPAPDNDAA